MPLRIEENLHMRDILECGFLQIREGKVEEIPPFTQHGHAGVV